MKSKIIAFIVVFMCFCQLGFTQENSSITGRVLDRWEKPISGALVVPVGLEELQSTTDRSGAFNLEMETAGVLMIYAPDKSFKTVQAEPGKPVVVIMGYADKAVHVGYDFLQNIAESTSSVSSTSGDEINKRGAKDIANSLFGNVLGLTALQNSDTYANYAPTFYVRGLQSLSTSTPLVLVDGIERDMSWITPEEVENVTVLKDAAAVAIYGYKGANGVINVVTKRGKYNFKEIKVSYDHAFNWDIRRPEFVNSYNYANAINEALTNDGLSTRYSQDELNAFYYGNYPYYYPNVDWVNETFKKTSSTDTYNVHFRGGGKNFRYYTLLNLVNNYGFVSNSSMNSGYSTQDKYSKANIRNNLDIDLTPKTKMTVNLLGSLFESSRPGDSANLWDMIYSIPSAAFPIQTEDGVWGGSATWAGTLNPVAQSQASAYSKGHTRALFADMTLQQDLSAILPGLGGNVKLAYDNMSSIWENHSKTYVYGSDAVTAWANGAPISTSRYTAGSDSEMSTSANVESWQRALNFAVSLNYVNTFGKHSVSSQLKYDYEYRNINGVDNTWYRHNVSLYGHYGYKDRYFADLTLVTSAMNKLAPGHKWDFSPTVSAAWVLSKEEFMKTLTFVDFFKLRASFGIINSDQIPAESYWEQIYGGGSLYNFDTGYTSSLGSWKVGQMASLNPKNEKAYKYNIGVDAMLFGGLNLTVDGYYQRRKDIWVASSGKYSTVLGFTAPYENGGVVDSYGVEIGADYFKKVGEVSLNFGANFTFSRNEIKEQLEEPKAYKNLVTTGKRLNQVYGMQAIGFFKDQDDINNSPEQLFSSVSPGDIKYKDVNGDGKIDANDKKAIGYSTAAPEIYYSFKLGAEWKGLGMTALFQGAANYSAMLTTKSVYWPLIDNTNISKHYMKNRWTSDNHDAKYPRLTTQNTTNNFQNNTVWLKDRSFLKLRHVEIYYNFSKSLLERTKVVNNAKIYARGVDLLCLDKIKIADPESYGANNPLNSSVVVGLSIEF